MTLGRNFNTATTIQFAKRIQTDVQDDVMRDLKIILGCHLNVSDVHATGL